MIIAFIPASLQQIRWELILGGFGLFLFGIKIMGDGLKNVAGDRLREYIDKYTSKPWMAVLIGAMITVIIQSSSATTSITIGLVRAGLMRLEQAAGIIMGANIGTTITAFLIGLSVEDYALYFVFIGACLVCFAKRKKTRYIGDVVLGFGALFYGLTLMGGALSQLKDMPEFMAFAETMSEQPILGLIAGAILTAVIQSSSAVIGIAQKLYQQGGIDLKAALPFVFGSNIGTTITGVLAAIGGSLAAKRTAGVHTLFNVLGTIIAMLLLNPFMSLVVYISGLLNLSPMMQIACAHIIFNIAATAIFFPFIKQLCQLIRKILPGDEPERIEIKIDDLSSDMAHQLPSTALGISKQAIIKMSTVAASGLDEVKGYFSTKNESHYESMLQSESIVNSFDSKITQYLALISREELTDQDMNEYTTNLEVMKNIERISDLSVNVVEFLTLVYEDRGSFSDSAQEEVLEMIDLLKKMLKEAITIYETPNFTAYQQLEEDERKMDLLEYQSRQKHFERMANKECTSAVGGSVYVDILGTIERMGDHTRNIAKSVMETTFTSAELNTEVIN